MYVLVEMKPSIHRPAIKSSIVLHRSPSFYAEGFNNSVIKREVKHNSYLQCDLCVLNVKILNMKN